MSQAVPDSETVSALRWLPRAAHPYVLLARFDRPIGWWLLFWPCAFGLGLSGGIAQRWLMLLWFLIGAIAMRGAGCVYNDIIDRDLDRQVERTRTRPLASGAVSLRAAWLWLLLLCAVGLLVLWQLTPMAQLVALASLLLVAAYPFMKRITWWPQAWLGIVFSWGILVAWVEVDGVERWAPMLALFAASALWVVGYDTIYALQDVEDDALVGIRSSARALGRRVRGGVAVCYALTLFLLALALWLVRPDPLVLAALLPAAAHMAWQVMSIDPASPAGALALFRSNRMCGLLIALACVTVGASA